MALPFTLKRILRPKRKESWKLKISPCKNVNFKNILSKETKIFGDIIITL
jgi:hypothetical protein